MSENEKVKEFHRVMGIPTHERPTMPDEATRVLRCRLLLEETLEFIHASGCSLWFAGTYRVEARALAIDVNGTPNLAAMAQENADVRYIAHGNDLAMGVDGRVFNEVHAANLAKASNGVVTRRADGKVVKPEGWSPPDVARVIEDWDLDSDPWERTP